MQSKADTPEGYLAELDPERRAEVEEVRSMVREAAPEAEESMQWGMLTYRVDGEGLVALASQKRYLSLYLDPEVLERHREELEDLDMGKSCIRFKRATDLPLEALTGIVGAAAQRGRADGRSRDASA